MNILEKNKNLKGMSLMSLVIMIIIMIILASAVVTSVIYINNNAKIVAFATDVSNIEKEVEAYYLENKELPKISTPTEYTKTTLTTLASSNGSDLASEITANLDTTDKFYEVDLAKINVTSSVLGMKKSGDNDIYVVNTRNLRIYYVKGYTIGTTTYFSLTDDLITTSNIQRGIESTSAMSFTSETDGIKITKSTKDKTNSLNMSFSSALDSGTRLRYSVAGVNPTNISGNTFETKLDLASMTTLGAVTNFTRTSPDPIKTFVVEKFVVSSGIVIAKATMNIDNLDIETPVISDSPAPVVAAFTDFNTLTMANISDTGGSNIKEIRYEGTTKLNNSNWVETYLNPSVTIDAAYLKTAGKKVTGNVIKLDKHIKSIRIIALDNAGNVSNMKTYSIDNANLVKESEIIKTLAYEITPFKARIFADSGEIMYLRAYNESINLFKSKSLYDSNILYLSTFGGIKKNIISTVEYVQKAYDIKNNDAAQVTAISQPGYSNQGFVFDGSNDVVTTAPLIIGNKLTICFWVNPSASSVKEMVIHGTVNSGAFEFFQDGLKVVLRGGTGTPSITPETNILTLGNWSFLCATIDITAGKIYKDGVFLIGGSVDTPSGSSYPLSIGGYADSQYPFNGKINEVMIFNKVLTANEVLGIYNATKGRYIVAE